MSNQAGDWYRRDVARRRTVAMEREPDIDDHGSFQRSDVTHGDPGGQIGGAVDLVAKAAAGNAHPVEDADGLEQAVTVPRYLPRARVDAQQPVYLCLVAGLLPDFADHGIVGILTLGQTATGQGPVALGGIVGHVARQQDPIVRRAERVRGNFQAQRRHRSRGGSRWRHASVRFTHGRKIATSGSARIPDGGLEGNVVETLDLRNDDSRPFRRAAGPSQLEVCHAPQEEEAMSHRALAVPGAVVASRASAGRSRFGLLFRVAGIGALATAILIPLQIVAFIVWPLPAGGVADWFELFGESPFIGLVSFDLVILIEEMLLIPIVLGLYVILRRADASLALMAAGAWFVSISLFIGSNTGFEMLALSNGYAEAPTAAERASYLAAGQAMLSAYMEQGSSFVVGYVLASIAGILAGIAMLRSPVFPRFAAWAAVVANVLGFGLFVPGIGVLLSIVSVLMGWSPGTPRSAGVWCACLGDPHTGPGPPGSVPSATGQAFSVHQRPTTEESAQRT